MFHSVQGVNLQSSVENNYYMYIANHNGTVFNDTVETIRHLNCIVALFWDDVFDSVGLLL